ncbi:MAG: SGNH/GDSL hydrolase family protein [Patescibacteria group bacterium]
MRKWFILIAAIFIFALLGFLYFQNNFLKGEGKKTVKAVTAVAILSPTPSPTPILTSTPTPTIAPQKPSYSIAIFGDSMVDTMGEKLEYLQEILANKYPQTKFNLYNYGIGGQNVEQGLARFESTFVNRERHFPPLPELNPDILIIGSFAYNPFPTHDRNKHYALLRELVAKARTLHSRIYLLAEVAPLKIGFGKGKNGVNMLEEEASKHAIRILEQLDNIVNLSLSENIPLVNIYHLSRIDGVYGDPYYVNQDDGIHPSFAGHAFSADQIVQKITFD